MRSSFAERQLPSAILAAIANAARLSEQAVVAAPKTIRTDQICEIDGFLIDDQFLKREGHQEEQLGAF